MAREDRRHPAGAPELQTPRQVSEPTIARKRRKTAGTVKTAGAAGGKSAQAQTGVPFGHSLLQEALAYQVDLWQRSVLFLETLRQRADNFFAHEAAGLPPLLDFDYELILDARRLDPPANYALLRVARCCEDRATQCEKETKAPVIVLDPRAGHGPGIGGFKHDSEVGIALHEGHPTYFVTFYPHPCTGQTLGDVLKALRRFIEEVSSRHPGKPPILYGNCQAGWAVMLLASECRGIAGPAVLNGSPLSYWAGAPGVNPMRLAGGLLGGIWMTHLLTDLSNGELDGAWLVANFENLNPANALWEKNYKLFSAVDTERPRFLEFERWWTGFYFLGREEILFIVGNLFIGNKLERGQLRLDDCCIVDLKRARTPLVVFASSEDNITPPHQALNWIPVIYPTTADLKRAGQRIVYLVNHRVGHLGIFVSTEVARREHRAILESLGKIEALAPGLYEMRLDEHGADGRKSRPRVRFHAREVSEVRFPYAQGSFEQVQAVSDWNESMYKAFVSPWVTALANPLGAALLKWLHPMRVSRYMLSDKLNPWMTGVRTLAPAVEAHRQAAPAENAFSKGERAMSASVATALKCYQQWRDAESERLFAALFGGRATASEAKEEKGEKGEKEEKGDSVKCRVKTG